ncbi:MAG: hypothetical protein RMA76_32025 [Deltaproteobacteria bacterium]|jgi:hypothetical protein
MLVDVLQSRLAPILTDYAWSFEKGIAVMHFLHQYHVVFEDGFSMNGDRHNEVLGFAEASELVSRLCGNPKKSPTWWKSRAPAGLVSSRRLADLLDELVVLFEFDPGVRGVSAD